MPNVYLKHFFENNNEEEVYKLFKSHLISEKAIEILLRDPFTRDDYLEFIEERKRTIILEKLNINNKKEIQEKIPSNIVEKITFRIEKERKKNPALVSEKENDINYILGFLDLQELLQIITNKLIWKEFENIFGTKDKLTIELNDVASLRNAIRHSREIDKITKTKGEASILWFEQQLKK